VLMTNRRAIDESPCPSHFSRVSYADIHRAKSSISLKMVRSLRVKRVTAISRIFPKAASNRRQQAQPKDQAGNIRELAKRFCARMPRHSCNSHPTLEVSSFLRFGILIKGDGTRQTSPGLNPPAVFSRLTMNWRSYLRLATV